MQTWDKLTCVRTQAQPPLRVTARKQGFVLSSFNGCLQGKNYFPIVALIKNKTKQKEPTVSTQNKKTSIKLGLDIFNTKSKERGKKKEKIISEIMLETGRGVRYALKTNGSQQETLPCEQVPRAFPRGARLSVAKCARCQATARAAEGSAWRPLRDRGGLGWPGRLLSHSQPL